MQVLPGVEKKRRAYVCLHDRFVKRQNHIFVEWGAHLFLSTKEELW